MEKSNIKGGEFLINDAKPQSVFIPEDITEEQQMIADMAKDFLNAEVFPNLDRIDSLEEGLMKSIMDKAGEMGLLGITIPEEYGGFGKDFLTGIFASEVLGGGHSFAVAHAAHTGIGTLPILYFGTEEQKKKYLPDLANGKMHSSYCLTEPGSGSDALAARTKAVLTDDGKHFVLNGQKMWITNAGFAKLFIVFAQVDPKGMKDGAAGFTGFIIEGDSEGLSLGNEEHKLGIKGSSTRQVFLSDCKVPVENVLGEIGQGHKIAFNILNIGRIKLACATLGGARRSINHAIKYAKERIQFKVPIASFGAIQYKIAEQASRIWLLETATYRASNNIEQLKSKLVSEGSSYSEGVLAAAEEYAIEAALLKILGSEVLDYVVDESVQIFGGYGYSEEYPVTRGYRDSRINRIFEGTNEINRLLSVDMLLKRAMKGQLNILPAAMAVQKELSSMPSFDEDEGPLAEETKQVANYKKLFLMCGGAAAQSLAAKLETEQEVVMDLADIMLITYTAESALLRVKKLQEAFPDKDHSTELDILRVYLSESAHDMARHARNSVMAWADGDELRMILLGVKRYTKTQPFNTKDARRRIAAKVLDQGKYKI